MNIFGKKVIFRGMEEKDCDLVIRMFNDPEIEDLVVGWAPPISLYSQKEWLKEHHNDRNNMRFIIETEEDGAVGIVTLYEIDWKNRRATHGLKIADQNCRDRGIGTDTVMAIMRYAFDELNLVRLDAGWLGTNTRSMAMYTKCGWTQEGVRRKYIYKKGSYRDMVLGGILAEEYYALIEANHYWDE